MGIQVPHGKLSEVSSSSFLPLLFLFLSSSSQAKVSTASGQRLHTCSSAERKNLYRYYCHQVSALLSELLFTSLC